MTTRRTSRRLRLAACTLAAGALAAGLPATRAGAQPARTDSGAIATFAREWSTGLGAPRCTEGAILEGRAAQCTWGPAQALAAPWLEYTPANVPGAPAAVMWHRLATDPAHAQRMIDSLDAALVARGAVRRACGTGTVPAGRVTGTVWERDALAVHVSRIDEPGGTARVLVAASDQPTVLSLDVTCPRPGAAAARRDTTRVRVLASGGIVFRPDSVRSVRSIAFAGDSAPAIVHYRTGRPIADSADARRTLARRLARPRSLDGDPIVQAAAGRDGRGPDVRRLVVRPCYVDVCPPTEGDRISLAEPGDFVFVRQPDRSWVPGR